MTFKGSNQYLMGAANFNMVKVAIIFQISNTLFEGYCKLF